MFLVHSNALHPLDGLVFIISRVSDTRERIATLLNDYPAHLAQKLLLVRRAQQCAIACAQGCSARLTLPVVWFCSAA
jgi:hypothetical protein